MTTWVKAQPLMPGKDVRSIAMMHPAAPRPCVTLPQHHRGADARRPDGAIVEREKIDAHRSRR